MEWSTQAWKFTTKSMVNLDFTLPEFSETES